MEELGGVNGERRGRMEKAPPPEAFQLIEMKL